MPNQSCRVYPPAHVFFILTASAVMCLNMPNLETKVEKREVIADRLEKTRSQELLTGKTVYHRCERRKGVLGRGRFWSEAY